MGLLQRFFGRKPAQFIEDQDEAEAAPRPTWDKPCEVQYGEYANAFSPCHKCGHLIRDHKACAPGSVTMVESVTDLVSQRAAHNARGIVLLAGEEPGRSASELVRAAGDSVPALAIAMTTIAQRFEDSVRNADQLNRALGEFKGQVVVPLLEELKFLRYNLGDKVNKTTTNMEVMVDQLDKTIWGALRASGLTDAQIRTYREEHGMQPEAPSGQELELHVAEHQALLRQVEVLTEQNRRLLELLGGDPEHVFWAEDAGQWVFHEGCVCQRCSAQAYGNELTREVSGEARRAAKPRRKRRS